MYELSLSDPIAALPSFADTAQLRRRRHYGGSTYRKNVCFLTLNGSGNGWSIYSFMNGFGGF
jgi:hypothetical protein